MSLSDILEILAMSRLIAIWTGSPVEGKKSLSWEKCRAKGTIKPLRMLRRVGSAHVSQKPKGLDTVAEH